MASVDSDTFPTPGDIHGSQKTLTQVSCAVDSESLMDANASKEVFDGSNTNLNDTIPLSPVSETIPGNNVGNDDELSDPMAVVPLTTRKFEDVSETKTLMRRGLLLKLAVESGSAFVLEDSSWDANIVYEKSVALAKAAPPGPVFRHGLKKLVVQGCDVQSNDDLTTKEAGRTSDNKVTISSWQGTGKKSSKRSSMKDIRADLLNVAPRGSLRVDELAKLPS